MTLLIEGAYHFREQSSFLRFAALALGTFSQPDVCSVGEIMMAAAQAGHAVEFLAVVCAGLLGAAVVSLVVLVYIPLLS